jgi:ribosomal protein S6E (S10)
MNYKIFLSILLVIGLLHGCTSEESQIKDVALEEAQQEYTSEIHAAVNERVHGKEIVKDNMVGKIIGRTEFEVDKVEITGTTANVVVKMKTVPLKVREALTDILVKLDPARENNFNVPDAIAMIYQQLGLKPEETSEAKKIITLHKDTVWKAQKPAP